MVRWHPCEYLCGQPDRGRATPCRDQRGSSQRGCRADQRDLRHDAWREVDADVRHRLAHWFEPQAGERFVKFFRDAEFSAAEAGNSGIVVTDRRIVHMYRFLWLNTKEIPVARIISISEARSFFEIITGRGSVVVSSGIGERQVIRIEDIDDPGPVASTLRELLPS